MSTEPLAPPVTDADVAAADSMFGLLPPIAFNWKQGKAVTVEAPRGRLYRIKGLVKAFNYSPPVVGQEQGQRDAERTDSIRRGGI
jgi:hypothetical protein